MLFFDKKEIDECLTEFIALENDEKIGSCMLKITDEAEVFSLVFDKDKPFVVEGLIKSSLNFAVYKNVYMAKCRQKDIEVFLKSMKFELDDDCYVSDIPTILLGSCNCHK